MPGGFLLITAIDGIRYAVRQNAIAAIQDADECHDETLIALHGGAVVRVSATLDNGQADEPSALPPSVPIHRYAAMVRVAPLPQPLAAVVRARAVKRRAVELSATAWILRG
jgi:hypothetical protein